MGPGVALEMDVPDGSPGTECGVGQLPQPSPPTVPPPASLSTPSSSPALKQAKLSDSCPHSGLAQGKAGWGLGTVLLGGSDGAVHTQRPTVRGIAHRAQGLLEVPSGKNTGVHPTPKFSQRTQCGIHSLPTVNASGPTLTGPSAKGGASLSVIGKMRTLDRDEMGGQCPHGWWGGSETSTPETSG